MRRCLENIIETYKMMKINKIIVLLIIGVSLAGDIQALKQEKKTNDQDEKLYRRAKSLEKAGLIDEAEQIFIQIFSSTPNNEKYYNALKKYVIKNEDCASLMEYTDIFYKARKFDKFSKLHLLEASIICNADWNQIFTELKTENFNDLKVLRKAISKLINNNESDFAIKAIYDIRSQDLENSAFYAMELGYYYLSLKEYKKSLIEYLYHLEKYPKHFQMISDRVMSFPNDSVINMELIDILNKSTILETKIILSDIYFKAREIDKAINILKENNLFQELLSLAINLDSMNEYKTAQELYIYIIENADGKLIEQTIYQFALTLEYRALESKSILPLSGFMNKNPFFSSPFIRINDKDSDYLYKAIALYDSLNIKNSSLNALYRLSEIRFTGLGDLDNAFSNYTKINNTTRDKDLKLQALLRIADILIAKGDLERASKIFAKESESRLWNPDQKIQLKVKENQILFYQSELDLVYDNLNQILKEYNVQATDYNEILETMSVVIMIKEEKELFEKYTQAQLKINQNKRTEAIHILDDLIGLSDNVLLNNMTNYQIANLLIYQDKPEEAISRLEAIEDGNIYKELSIIFLAEIYDLILKDSEKSKIYYLSILQNYPLSIYYENIRVRLKEIMAEAS